MKLYIFLNLTFVNLDCDLAHTYQNVHECMTFKCASQATCLRSLYKACKLPFFHFMQIKIENSWKKKLERIKFLQSFLGIHASQVPVKDGYAWIRTSITRSIDVDFFHNPLRRESNQMALKMLCFHKCKSKFRTLSKKTWRL